MDGGGTVMGTGTLAQVSHGYGPGEPRNDDSPHSSPTTVTSRPFVLNHITLCYENTTLLGVQNLSGPHPKPIRNVEQPARRFYQPSVLHVLKAWASLVLHVAIIARLLCLGDGLL
jgi:hypothetical protein